MKIISKYRDYYDSCASRHGVDNKLLFVRHEREIESEREQDRWPELRNFPSRFMGTYRGKVIYLSVFVIGFCGKLYRGIFSSERAKNCLDYKSNYWYSFNGINDYMLLRYKFKENPLEKKSYHDSTSFRMFMELPQESKSFRDRCIAEQITIISRFQEPFSHSINGNNATVLVNHSLGNVEFFRIFSPYMAFQEISMWVGGALNQPERPMIKVSNEVKIHKHGFDKYSFRKLPTKRKSK